MNILYLLNHFIFSIFITMLLVEGGFAMMALVAYKKYKDSLMRYITPIWEVTGTFAVFYAVSFEATFPQLLTAGGTIYAIPLLFAASLLIIRNAFLVYSMYIADLKAEVKNLRIYALATMAALLLFLSVLSSAMSGIGINLAKASASIFMYLNPFNILVIVSALLLSLSLAGSIFKVERLSRITWLPISAAIVIFYFGAILFANSSASHFPSALSIFPIIVILVAALGILEERRSKYLSAFMILIVVFLVNLLGIIEYPYIFGTLNVTSYMASSALAMPILIITLLGGGIVAASLTYLIYLSYLRK